MELPMIKVITILLFVTLISCQQPKLSYKQRKPFTSKSTKLYKLGLTESGLRRVKLAIELYEEGKEYEYGYKYHELVTYTVISMLIGVSSGYYLGGR